MGGVGVGQRLGTYWKVFSCEDMGDCEWVQWMGGKGGVTKGRKMVRRSHLRTWCRLNVRS